ncbi:MAG TPA: hypothetical protein VHP36_02015 [Chitinispirillaceae bacterium]|nr:hypothetical protein [Chitinispirillaceae bacterium]
MSDTFSPIEELDLFCRFCNKVIPAQLDRSIAENGRVLDRSSTFEYYCTKCFKTACFSGTDLLENNAVNDTPRIYKPTDHFFLGETIFHQKFNETGIVVGKDNGAPGKIIVQFKTAGLKKLIQDI